MCRTSERGFTLLELTVCVAILALAGAATIGAVAAVARRATPGTTRDVALMVAENVLARARAAVAYVPAPGDPAASARGLGWGLQPGTTTFNAGARLRAAAICGGAATLDLVLPVAVTYDGGATLSVDVTYPRDPCAVRGGVIPSNDRQTLHVATLLAPPAFAPGERITRTIAPPARM